MENKPAGQGAPISKGKYLLAGMVAIILLGVAIMGAGTALADVSYRVQPGDTLSGIASRYGITVDAIVAANNLPNRSVIYAGETLTIPTSSGNSGGTSQPTGTYVVQYGDSLSAIAARFGTTVDALMRANGLPNTTIYAGQVLKIVPANYSAQAPAPTQQPQATPTATIVPPTLTPVLPTSTPVPATAAPVVGTTTPLPAQSPTQAPPGQPVKYTVQQGDSLTTIAARFSTTVATLMQLNGLTDPNFVYAGEVLVIIKGDDQSNTSPSSTGTSQPGFPIPTPTPPMGAFGPKWVDVNLTTQMMIAYEGETPVYSSKVSSGIPDHPTVIGTYRIYAKYLSTRMQGGTPGIDYYDIPNVPYTMYFYSGYALHGAYWHNNFGHPMSHGCVNLPVDVSKWMFDWAPIGTMVVTHY